MDRVVKRTPENHLWGRDGGVTPLLTPMGRILFTLLEHPEFSQKDLAGHMGLSESRISTALLSLVRAKIVVRTKIDGQNRYLIDKIQAQNHSDIKWLTDIMLPLVVDGLEVL